MLTAVIKLILIFLLSFPLLALSKVEARWLSVTSVYIDDGETRLLFDAAWTRPHFFHWLGISDFKSDEEVVDEVLKGQNITKLSAVFVTHTHFDHCVDAPLVAKKTGSKLFVSKSMLRIARAYKDSAIRIKKLHPFQMGKFKISMYRRVHADILGLFEFLPGTVPKDFDFGFYDYKVGESWIYLLEHPEGSILIDTSGDANLKWVAKDQQVDVIFQGVANRKDNDAILDGYVKALKPTKFIATHFDPFMFGFRPGPQTAMGNVDFPGLQKSFKDKAPQTEFIIPEYGTPIPLF